MSLYITAINRIEKITPTNYSMTSNTKEELTRHGITQQYFSACYLYLIHFRMMGVCVCACVYTCEYIFHFMDLKSIFFSEMES